MNGSARAAAPSIGGAADGVFPEGFEQAANAATSKKTGRERPGEQVFTPPG